MLRNERGDHAQPLRPAVTLAAPIGQRGAGHIGLLPSNGSGGPAQRIRDSTLNLSSCGDQLQAVVGVPGTGSLSISIAQYLNLVDWTGRQMHPGKRGKIDPERPRILDRLGLTDRSWTSQVKATESDFYRVIGAAESIIDYAKRAGQHWFHGLGVARELCKMRPKPG